MNNILIIYDTVSNSTEEAAETIHKNLSNNKNNNVIIQKYDSPVNIEDYNTIIIGSPMRFGGFNSHINKFITKNSELLKIKKIYFFLTCLYLIEDLDFEKPKFPIFIDPSFNAKPIPLSKMNMMDKTHSNTIFIETIQKKAKQITPAGIAYFKGRLNFSKLNLIEKIFMRIITLFTNKEEEGDFLNTKAIEKWSGELIL